MAVLVHEHVPGLNGPAYWRWDWRALDAARLAPMLVALGPLLVAQWVYGTERWPRWFLVALLMMSAFGLQLAAAVARPAPPGTNPIANAVSDDTITSYFTDAAEIRRLDKWIATYHERLPSFRGHSRNKPPLPILYYLPFIKAWGHGTRAALAGGLGIGLLATWSVAATYLLVRQLTGRADAAFHAASVLAISPSLTLWLPEFDQVLPVIACLLLVVWSRALRRESWRAAVAAGALLALATLTSYSMLTLGVFMTGQVLIDAKRSTATAPWWSSVKAGFDVVATWAALLWTLWMFAHYHALLAFRAALAAQAEPE
jgi:hypothetical protein